VRALDPAVWDAYECASWCETPKMVTVAIGGSASTGKTTAASKVAELLQLDGIVHVDDLSRRMQMTGQKHFLDELEHPWFEPAEALAEQLIEWTVRLHPPVRAAVESLTAGGVIEGEGVDPRVSWGAAVIPVYVIETDDDVLWKTFRSRSSAPRFLALTGFEQRTVVEMNRRYAEWLRDAVEAAGQPWVASQPLDTLAERMVEATE
jgi:hypothetical protein